MVEKNAIYKCNLCGNVVEVLEAHNPSIVCCGQDMVKQEPKSKDSEGKEKHVPVIEKTDNGIKIKVGSVPHPMEEKHYIGWIEVLDNGKSCRKFLKPGDAPEASPKANISENAIIRAYCNIHGLWKS